jgi:hypothetical protein
MTKKEMKLQTLALIEEVNPDSEFLTEDPDIAAKIDYVTNMVMFEMCRLKKIGKYTEMSVEKGDLVTFEDIGNAVGYEIYQLGTVCGADHLYKANGTVLKVLESGTLEVDCYVYPERITENTKDSYEFELSQDVLEIMPYGIAADLLKSDVSADYGKVYAERYEAMKNMLDPRFHMGSVRIEGGVSI